MTAKFTCINFEMIRRAKGAQPDPRRRCRR
jgi:hypothetical protein